MAIAKSGSSHEENLKPHAHNPGTHNPGTHSHDANGHHHGHVHDPESLQRILNRFARIEGHIRGIKTMVQDGRPCPDVLVQIAAVRGALDRVSRIILDEHLSQCITRASEKGNIEAEIDELKAALDRFLP
ncbi:metal-sensitive transcriptional regulator [Oscillatoria sp. CS-180]|uniref:metal-sensitive transcriptional regulator n=1 Tax=Oscillatoria sp. CS-180 TaxID=3021720 RepID=UPI00232C4CFF|nr:metal-sensitive transcriptional regulator [Oscillatoria sp. CS-180]MDB9525688.1 metal-sensitive transcriptional regulator [Oscillatoria sp. CS-180]